MSEQKPTRLLCRHCNQHYVNRPKGLCWRCYYAPGVSELYPSKSKYAFRGVGNGQRKRPLPTPTDTLPGAPERVAVLEERAAREEALWHPDDATRPD